MMGCQLPTNLNWFSRRMSEPSTVCVSLVMSRYEQNKVRGPVKKHSEQFLGMLPNKHVEPHDQIVLNCHPSKRCRVSCRFHDVLPRKLGGNMKLNLTWRTYFFSNKWPNRWNIGGVSQFFVPSWMLLRHRNFMEH